MNDRLYRKVKVSKLAKDIYDKAWAYEHYLDSVMSTGESCCTGNTTARLLRLISDCMMLQGVPVSIADYFPDIHKSALQKNGGVVDQLNALIESLGFSYFVLNHEDNTISYDIFEDVYVPVD